MPACSIPGCKSGYATQSDGKKYMSFQLPKSEEMKAIWISKIYRENFEPSKNTIVCSRHFLEDDFVPDCENLTTKVCSFQDSFFFKYANLSKYFSIKVIWVVLATL